MKICIATSANYTSNPWREDLWLSEALTEAGCSVALCDWKAPEDWQSFDAIFVSSTWNIPSAPQAFLTWLEACEADNQRRLINDRELLALGIHKDTYWKVLETSRDLELVNALTPSRFALSAGRHFSDFVKDCMEVWPDERLVFKPIISSSSANTFVFDPSGTAKAHDPERVVTSADVLRERLQSIWSDDRLRGLIAQPYLSGIEAGEKSATFVGGKLVSAVQKMPGFGPMASSTLAAVTDKATLDELSTLGRTALSAITAHASAPVRARLDVIPHQDGMRILEVELVEPSCNFSPLEPSARNDAIRTLADAIIKAAKGDQ